MIYYLDASVLLKVYFYEKGTEAMVDLLKSNSSFFSSTIIYPEVLFGLKRRLQNKEITQDFFSKQIKLFGDHFRTLINRIEFNDYILHFLRSEVLKYSVKALDAIHLASALWLREEINKHIKFVCSDKDFIKIVQQEGFEIINPEENEMKERMIKNLSDVKIKSLWEQTKERFESLERELVNCYISFLREVAKYYLQQGRRVFFSENRVVHWGEGDFGRLVIEGEEETDEVFGNYISEIRFEPTISKKIIEGYEEIKEKNLKDIKYMS
ncbi:MAG: type II toxin-antitoxin system VapC family toxin [bacterium]